MMLRMFSWFKKSRRRRLRGEAFPQRWIKIFQRNVPHYARLPLGLQESLRGATQIIVAERAWEGCNGLQVTEEMQVTIAGQAALLLLGNEGYYFDRVPSILLYPMAYKRMQTDGVGGLVTEETGILGEAWHRGSIVLSWPSVLAGCREQDGSNLVLHEFAHHLDGLDGVVDGIPPLPTRHALDQWERIFNAEFAQLHADLKDGYDTLFDPYGAESKAEFFAVVTECFFELPLDMRHEHPDLFRIFAEFYRLNPALWQPSVPTN